MKRSEKRCWQIIYARLSDEVEEVVEYDTQGAAIEHGNMTLRGSGNWPNCPGDKGWRVKSVMPASREDFLRFRRERRKIEGEKEKRSLADAYIKDEIDEEEERLRS